MDNKVSIKPPIIIDSFIHKPSAQTTEHAKRFVYTFVKWDWVFSEMSLNENSVFKFNEDYPKTPRRSSLRWLFAYELLKL